MNVEAFRTLFFAVLSVLVTIAPTVQPASASESSDIYDYSGIGTDTSPGGRCRFFTVASDGNRTGMDPFSGRILTDVPHSGFGDESVEKTRPYYVLLINSPVSGSYETHVVGVTEAPFEINFTLISRSGIKSGQSFDFEGVIKPGREYIYQVQKISSMKPIGESFEARPASGQNDGNIFRFDPEKKEYTYLMDASDLKSGVWKLIVLLDDGSRQTTWIGIE